MTTETQAKPSTTSLALTRRLFTGGLASAAATWPFTRALAAFERKHALLIGNRAYTPAVGRLKNTVNDIELIARALKRQSFNPAKIVQAKEVANADRFLAEVDAYLKRLRQAGPEALGFFYYCGHGVANGGDRRNYLIPTGVVDARSSDLWTESVETGALFEKLSAHKGPQIVVLDCCRSSLAVPGLGAPSVGELPPPATGRIKGRGLVAVRAQQRPNMFICYSAWEGEVASDGVGDATNGPFAKALDEALHSLRERTTHDIFKQTQLAVAKATGGEQLPMPVDLLNDAASRAQFFGKWATPVPRPGAKRQDYALVVANSHAGTPLERPLAHADGERMAQALRKCGFSCDLALDLSRENFFARLRAFAVKLKAGGEDARGILFYSGYGAGRYLRFEGNVEIRENYLLPNRFTPKDQDELNANTSIEMTKIVSELSRTNARAVAIVKDVNRFINNSITPKGMFGWGRMRAQLEQQNRNIMIVHSAGEDQDARDDANGSIFVQALARAFVSTERRSFQEVLNDVQRQVFEATRTLPPARPHQRREPQKPQVDSANQLPIFFADETGLGRGGAQ